MNWKARERGTQRIRKTFALFPMDCIDGRTYWLTFVYSVENWTGFSWCRDPSYFYPTLREVQDSLTQFLP